MQNLNVNITPDNYPQSLYYSQNDVGREFKINITDFTIPVGATVKIQATKPSGFGFSVAGTVSGNSVTFETTAEMTDEAGRFPAELVVTSGSDVIGTANFLMVGERNPHPEGTIDGQQETIIPELTLLVERAEAAASSVLDMQVVAQTLPAGSQASYSYDEDLNKATFGIPEGQAGAGAAGVVASAYSAAKTYKVGDYVLYNSNLYKCTTAITTAEAWTAAHWTQVVLADDVTDLKTDLNLNSFLTIGNNLYKALRWEKGTVRDNTNVETSNDARLRSNYVEVFTKEITLDISNGLLVYLFEFANDKTFVYEGGWHTGIKKVTLKDGTKYVRVIVKNSAGDSSISVADGKLINAYEYSFLTQKEYKIDGSDLDWHSGCINKDTGAETDTGTSSYRCTNFIKLPTQLALNLLKYASYASGNACSVAFYDESKTFISSTSRADASSTEVTLPNGTSYVKLTTYPSSLSTDNAFFIVYTKPIDNVVDLIKSFNNLFISENVVWG